MLSTVVKPVYNIYERLFQELPDEVEQSNEEITEGFDASLCDPPYNTGRAYWSASSEYYRSSLKDMPILDDELSIMMPLGTHWHIFCSGMRFII